MNHTLMTDVDFRVRTASRAFLPYKIHSDECYAILDCLCTTFDRGSFNQNRSIPKYVPKRAHFSLHNF